MNQKLSLFSLLSLLFIATACEEDVDINAPAKDVTAVVGLLDPNETTHLVKITRLFQGEDGILTLAQNRELAEYDDIEAFVEEYEYDALSGDTNATSRSWQLYDTIVTNKDSGLFYYPNQTVYAFDARLRSADNNNNRFPLYKLVVNKPNGEQVTSWTPTVNIPITNGVQNVGEIFPDFGQWLSRGVLMMNQTVVNVKVEIEVFPPVNSKGLELRLHFRWKDLDENDVTLAEREVTIGVGTKDIGFVPERTIDREVEKFDFSGETFYQAINAATQPLTATPEISKRLVDTSNLSIELWIAGEELQTFIELNSPSQTLLEEKPAYSNVNNGIGVWSARTRVSARVKISSDSMEELIDGIELGLTGDRGFCDNNAPNGTNYSCN